MDGGLSPHETELGALEGGSNFEEDEEGELWINPLPRKAPLAPPSRKERSRTWPESARGERGRLAEAMPLTRHCRSGVCPSGWGGAAEACIVAWDPASIDCPRS